jgi:hypothetical protein
MFSHLGHYFLASCGLMLAVAWLATRLTSPSARARQWQSYAALAAFPVAIIAQWWWTWPLDQLSLGSFWLAIEIGLVLCLSLSLLATWPRRWLKIQFANPIAIVWPRCGLILLAAIVAGQLAPSLPWPIDWTISALLLAGGLVVLIYVRSSQLFISQLISLGLAAAAIIGAAALTSGLHLRLNGPQLWGWPLGIEPSALLALLALAWSWPAIINWCLNQSWEAWSKPKSTKSTRHATSP